ncbi:MAG: hypothetical protein WBD31_18160 [Rubripirellula sp.]
MPISVDDLVCERRDSRTVHHDRCNTDLEIADNTFGFATHPYSRVKGLSCPNCGMARFDTLRWSDTGELISDYRRRVGEALYNSAPKWVQRFPLILAVSLGLLAGGAGFLATVGLAGVPVALFFFVFLGLIGLACGFGLGYISRGAKLSRRLETEHNIDARHVT